MDNKVAVVRCENYIEQNVDMCVKNAVDLLGGMGKFVKQGQIVALKVNLVSKATPERCVTTHPAVVKAVVKLIEDVKAKCIIVDSPGGPYNMGYLKGVYDASKMTDIEKTTSAKCNDNFEICETKNENAKVAKSLKTLEILEKADVIINICKLKTHGYTGFTNAVKNMFGAVPGLAKTEMHGQFKTLDIFSDFLYDIFRHFGDKITLNICDAVVGMEGAGPTHGTPKQYNAILVAENPAALDVCGCKILNVNPFDMPTTAGAISNGFLDENMTVQVLGDPIENFVCKNVNVPTPSNFTPFASGVPKFLQAPITRLMSRRPVISKRKCRGCTKCQKHCPMGAITMKPLKNGKKYAQIDYSKCIRCFCCQELCPFGVVKIKSSLIYKIVNHRRKKNKK